MKKIDIKFICIFCGRIKKEVNLFINQLGINICDICIHFFNKIVNRSLFINNRGICELIKKLKNIKPIYIKYYLDKYIIGQHEAKKSLSVAVYIHYKRIINNLLLCNNINIEKSNIILIGPTGTGKTYMLKIISKLFNVPFVIVNATSFTESGYVGDDVESILIKLYRNSNYNLSLTEIGIVFIDEIDKICRKSGDGIVTKDISGEGVQQALLKMLEGSIIEITIMNIKKFMRKEIIRINTENILFIVGGAFVNLNNSIYNRLNKTKIGYNNINTKYKKKNMYKYITHKDLINYGFIPEFIGRLPIIANTNPLTILDLKNIILYVKNSILLQYSKIFNMEGKKFYLSKRSVNYIIKKSIKINIGARSLKNIFSKIFKSIIFNIHIMKNVFFINKKFVKKAINSNNG
ncbi:MAG: ATP-dependent Clp protease ATP-binding subunit ClpX [Candidatus Shikimatogenerans sp. Tder]|uniref:ATP-dependent Clp protease ATP-binding subunit ClpX n=1 Tax=Candidatus Shikimatogenerans sp. Tder TaxID=3158566 RepID=A0AAU7QT41_9FLAO